MKGRCPTCGKAYEIQAVTELPTFPFCSGRCRLIDLGRWIDGKYVVPGPDVPAESGQDADPDSDEE
jgi:uncharacterized protein